MEKLQLLFSYRKSDFNEALPFLFMLQGPPAGIKPIQLKNLIFENY